MLATIAEIRSKSLVMELRYRDVQERYRTMAMYGLFVSEPLSLFLSLFLYSRFSLFVYFLAMLGLHCCKGFLAVASRGYSPVAVLELLTEVASPVAEHRF